MVVGATRPSGIYTVPPVLYRTVELIFYNIITTIDTIFLESLGDESGIRFSHNGRIRMPQ